MNNINIERTERYGIGFWIDIYTNEDHFFIYSDRKKELNSKRNKKIVIDIIFIKWNITIFIPYKHVGNIYYGRKMKE